MNAPCLSALYTKGLLAPSEPSVILYSFAVQATPQCRTHLQPHNKTYWRGPQLDVADTLVFKCALSARRQMPVQSLTQYPLNGKFYEGAFVASEVALLFRTTFRLG
jgi:hypothetical protein